MLSFLTSCAQPCFPFLLLILVALDVQVLALPLVPAPGYGCPSVHVITVGASTQGGQEGILKHVIDEVVRRSHQTVSREAIYYPARFFPAYLESKNKGVMELKHRLSANVLACPRTNIVLTGYSQGAHVVGDVLAEEPFGGDNVAAVVLMGDPGHTRGESFQRGTAGRFNGLYPRYSDALEDITSKIVSYCDNGDIFCARGSRGNPFAHDVYVAKYGGHAVDFILGRIGG